MIEIVKYEPTEKDRFHMKEITDFLEETGIPYVEDEANFGVIHIKDGTIQLRYVDSAFHGMDNEKRFGPQCKGIQHDYFISISHENLANGIRTIWIFDFEMEEENPIVRDGKEVMFRRQWEVIKNTIRTATGHIKHRFSARDCEIHLVPNSVLRPFLNENCFYGYRAANVNLGLYLKKAKNGFPAGTLLMVYTFGYNFYGNKCRMDDPFIEIIRVSTKLSCQVIGGASKCLTYFFENYPTMEVGGQTVKVREVIFYVDASHNDARAMRSLNFRFKSWQGAGFMNLWLEDYCSEDGKLKGSKGEIFQRKPLFHKQIMDLISKRIIVSIANAGTIVYATTKNEFFKGIGHPIKEEETETKETVKEEPTIDMMTTVKHQVKEAHKKQAISKMSPAGKLKAAVSELEGVMNLQYIDDTKVDKTVNYLLKKIKEIKEDALARETRALQ